MKDLYKLLGKEQEAPGEMRRQQREQQQPAEQEEKAGTPAAKRARLLCPAPMSQAPTVALQLAGPSLQQQQQLASAPPQVQSALVQHTMPQQQAAVQAQAQPQQMSAAQQARWGAAVQLPPLLAQLSPELQLALAAQYLAQLPLQQQAEMAARPLAPDQMMHLLQSFYQSKVLAGGGQGRAPLQWAPPL